MSNISTMETVNDSVVSLEMLNVLDSEKYLYTLIVLIIIICIGMIGNSVVIYIYKNKFKRSSARVYIISLAIADLSVCLVGLPYHVLDLTFTVNYTNRAACRALSFLIGSCTLSSIFILLVVGLDRYLKVCHPLRKQIIDFGDRKACMIAAGIACVLNIPNGIIYGNSTVTISEYNSTGFECFIDDEYSGSVFAAGFLGINLLIFVLSCVYLIVIYAFIGRKIYQQAALEMPLDKKGTVCLCCSRRQLGLDDEDEEIDDKANVVFDKNDSEAKATIDLPDIIVEDTGNSLPNTSASNTKNDGKTSNAKGKASSKTQSVDVKKKKIKKVSSATMIRHTNPDKQSKEKNTRKITLMMMTITIVFILTYLPFIALSIVDVINEEFWDDLTANETVLYDLLLRLYLLNNVANPLIYSFWDNRFRREVIRLVRKLACCKSDAPSKHEESSSSSGTTKRTMHETIKFN